MKQSSVEWLIEILKGQPYDGKEFVFCGVIGSGLIEQAKAMHQKEHEDAFIKGAKSFREGQAFTEQGFREISRILYSETFGKSEQ